MPPPSKKRKAMRQNGQLTKFYAHARKELGLKKPSIKFEVDNGEIESGFLDESMRPKKSSAANKRNLELARRCKLEKQKERKTIREAIESGRLVLNVPIDTLPEWVRNDDEVVKEEEIKLEPEEDDPDMIRRQMTPMSPYEITIQSREQRQKERMNESNEAIRRAPFLHNEPFDTFPVNDEYIKSEHIEEMSINSSTGFTNKVDLNAERRKILELSRIRREQNREESKAIENGKLFSIYEREAIEEAAKQRQRFYMESSDLPSEHPENIEDPEESIKLEEIDEDPSMPPPNKEVKIPRRKCGELGKEVLRQKREAINKVLLEESIRRKSILDGIAHDHCYLARDPPLTADPPSDLPPSLAPQTTALKSNKDVRMRREYERRLNDEAAARVQAIRQATAERMDRKARNRLDYEKRLNDEATARVRAIRQAAADRVEREARNRLEYEKRLDDEAAARVQAIRQATVQRMLHHGHLGEQMIYAQTSQEFMNNVVFAARPSSNRNTMLEGLESQRRRSEKEVREPKVEWLEEEECAPEVPGEVKIEVKEEEIEYEMFRY